MGDALVWSGPARYQAVPRSYGWNFALNIQPLGKIQFPAECIAIADSNNFDEYDPYRECCPTGYIAPVPRNTCCATHAPFGHVSARHNGGANHVMADGHAKWMKLSGNIQGNSASTRYWQPTG